MMILVVVVVAAAAAAAAAAAIEIRNQKNVPMLCAAAGSSSRTGTRPSSFRCEACLR